MPWIWGLEGERTGVRRWNDAWSYLYEGGKRGVCVCVCLTVYWCLDVCTCLHNAWTPNVYVWPLVYTHAMALFSCGCFQINISLYVSMYVPTIMTACSNFVCEGMYFHNCVFVCVSMSRSVYGNCILSFRSQSEDIFYEIITFTFTSLRDTFWFQFYAHTHSLWYSIITEMHWLVWIVVYTAPDKWSSYKVANA